MGREEILSRLLSNISDEFDKSVGSFFYDTQKPLAIELEQAYTRLEEILLNGFASTAGGEYLNYKAAEQGITRKESTYAKGSVLISGSPGAVIQSGDKVASETLIFTCLETKTVPSNGTATAAVQCGTPGAAGNVPIGSIKKFPITLPGLTSVTNTEAFQGGYDAETDGELRTRYFDKVSAPISSGNKYHYMNWAKEVAGVGDVKVIPLWNGPGTVKVILINANGGAADQELIGQVTAKIEDSRPIGAAVTVESAVPLEIAIAVSLSLQTGALPEKVKLDIEALIRAYLKRTAFSQSYISYAQIGGAILSADGVLDYADLMLNGSTSNIPVAENQVAVLGTVNIT